LGIVGLVRNILPWTHAHLLVRNGIFGASKIKSRGHAPPEASLSNYKMTGNPEVGNPGNDLEATDDLEHPHVCVAPVNDRGLAMQSRESIP
jgi:hypothetical protein